MRMSCRKLHGGGRLGISKCLCDLGVRYSYSVQTKVCTCIVRVNKYDMAFTSPLSSLTKPMQKYPEAKSKEKHGVWDLMAELTITSPYVDSGVDSNTFTMGNPMPESTLYPNQRLWI